MIVARFEWEKITHGRKLEFYLCLKEHEHQIAWVRNGHYDSKEYAISELIYKETNHPVAIHEDIKFDVCFTDSKAAMKMQLLFP